MGAELSIPGFGWATPVSGVTLSPGGFPFEHSSNKDKLVHLLKNVKFDCTDPDKFYDMLISKFKQEVPSNDFDEIIETGSNCRQQLKWDVMSISPNLSFKLHAHPNCELIYVISGSIHEYRYQGPELSRDLLPIDKADAAKKVDLTSEASKFVLQSVAADGFIVNKPGSVHLSFTRNEKTVLLVLWSGRHADLASMGAALPLPEEVQPL